MRERHCPSEFDTSSGWVFEADTIGEYKHSLLNDQINELIKNRHDLRQAIMPGNSMSKKQEREILKIAQDFMDNDPDYDPEEPRKPYADDLQLALEQELEKEVKFYTTVGTAIDRKGIDGFFVCQGEIVTIDITKNEQKLGSRSDIVLLEGEDIIDYYERAEVKNARDIPIRYKQGLKNSVSKIVGMFREKFTNRNDQLKTFQKVA